MNADRGGTVTLRRSGTSGLPALWLIHALGDSSRAFESILTGGLGVSFELWAPDWPGAGGTPADPDIRDLDGLADWLVQNIDRHTPRGPIGLVGHSLGAAVAVKAARRQGRTVGLVSIEGNLTAADAYLSGLATGFESAEDYRSHLLGCVQTMAESAPSSRAQALRRYHDSLKTASPETLWRLGRSAAAASRRDALGDEYQAQPMPGLYYWSRDNTPPRTVEYVRRHSLRNVEFRGGHWPMIEQPEEMASVIAAFFRPIFTAHEGTLAP
jgi:pimeloyl-ACP methyl ester carboxylesterase